MRRGILAVSNEKIIEEEKKSMDETTRELPPVDEACSCSPRGVLEMDISTPTGKDSNNNSIVLAAADGGGEGGEVVVTDNSLITLGLVDKLAGGNPLHLKRLFETPKMKSVRKFTTIPLLAGYELSKNLKKKTGRNRSTGETIDCGDFIAPKPSWRNFKRHELAAATDDFSPERMIGKGGHAEVYKGTLPDGSVVAVKKIIKKKNEEDEKNGDFLSELGIIAHIDHPNAAKLIGFSIDGGLHLVLQFSPHGSLASVLHGSDEKVLEWSIRFKVALGIAEGLHYLHSSCQRRIIHRDITASNILLTEDYEPQISDFGLAKWLPENWVHHIVHPIEGTFGYMAPEYFMHGIVDEKTDVFAFSVLLLELITGRRAVDSSMQSLVMWAKPLLEKKCVDELADPRLEGRYDVEEMYRAMSTALACLHHSSSNRPKMSRVVQLLKGEGGSAELKQKSLGGRAILLDACDLEDYNKESYQNDLTRHMQLVME
ncbi:receptor-like cytosolic serine/threonine-protein kinase RBK1 [Impatiens glandulifera]|uniref:receptor-like cytosolic serine/threonine-protein kinase RBK1 n=1 Tax=Impatiens glandulifera TaxID=253017 RepID=UPI001FB0A7C6|nr:receptor-like cytosolic serine/threonine-protein kinase RBK1 [Impatiens glandulifera]